MKPKPLRDKTYYRNVKNAEGKTNQKYPHHYDDDIKSAVEWLNDKVMESSVNLNAEEVLEYISEAFEDVVSTH